MYTNYNRGHNWSRLEWVAQWVRKSDYLTTHTGLSPIPPGLVPGLCKLQKGCTRLAAANANAYQLLAHCQWFSQGTPASYTSKNGCHDLAEILLKNGVKHQNHSYSTDWNDAFSALVRPLSVVFDITGWKQYT